MSISETPEAKDNGIHGSAGRNGPDVSQGLVDAGCRWAHGKGTAQLRRQRG